ncbi:hypothetical protein V1506DRAFT_505006 [Lipomyces tetrasporus]
MAPAPEIVTVELPEEETELLGCCIVVDITTDVGMTRILGFMALGKDALLTLESPIENPASSSNYRPG